MPTLFSRRNCIQWLACSITACSLLFSSPISSAQDRNGKELFNGKDLTGWEGLPKLWSVEEGAITGTTTAEEPLKNNTFLIWKGGTVGDFELTLEYRIQGGNSGIQYRSKVLDAEKFIVGGYQADIDSTMRYTGINYEEKGRGIMAERGQVIQVTSSGEKKVVGTCGDPAALASKVSKDGWNRYKIIAKGNKLQHYINDILMSELIDEQTEKGSKEGILAFQVHTGPAMKVQFKNILLK